LRYRLEIIAREEERDSLVGLLEIGRLKCAIWDYDQKLRAIAKYGTDDEINGETELTSSEADKARTLLWEIFSNEGITSEDIC